MRKLHIILLICAISITSIIILRSNFSGECKEVGRILTKEELIKRALRKDIYQNNTDCCGISPGNYANNIFENFINKVFGRYHYILVYYYKRPQPLTYDKNEPYFEGFMNIDECGKPVDSMGMNISEKAYQSSINIKQEKRNEANGN